MRLTHLLAVATLAVSLAGAELALRLARPLWAIPYPPVCYRPDLFQRWDPYGYRLWPSRTMQARYPRPDGRLVTIVSNPDGFRSRRGLHEADGRRRVVVLGDSMVFGVGVEEAERCTEVLEALEPGWRVDNLGMVGYGPDLMLRALEAVGLDPPPDVVVLVIFSHDVYRVAPEVPGVGFPLPRFALRSGRLATVPYPERPAWQRLFLVQGLRYVQWRYTSAAFPLNEAILDRVIELGAQHRFTPALVFAPGPRDWSDDRRRRRWLRAYAERRHVPFLDLTEPVQAAGAEALYLRNDAHWNPEGHRLVARELEGFLRRLSPPLGVGTSSSAPGARAIPSAASSCPAGVQWSSHS